MSTTTNAVIVETTGGPEQLRFTTFEVPDPGPDELLVRVAAAGVNFIDIYQRIGLYPMELPIHLGREGAGVVEAVGSDVTDIAVGDVVAWLDVLGSYAGHALIPAARAVPVPDGVAPDVAAAAMLQGATAHFLTHDTFALRPGHIALVQAAAGGVGQLLCQYAQTLGARVIGTAGTREKAQIARDAGADEVILYRDEDVVANVQRMTDGAGVHVVYDGVGKSTFEAGLEILQRRGYMVSFGNASGAVEPVAPLVLSLKGSLFLTRPTLNDYVVTTAELRQRCDAVLNDVAAGRLKIDIGLRLPLAEAVRAHELLAGRKTTGKTLLIPDH